MAQPQGHKQQAATSHWSFHKDPSPRQALWGTPDTFISNVTSELMDVTSYTAGEGSVSMVLSVIRFGMSFALFSSVAAFA